MPANTTFRNKNLFCLNCGGEKALVYPCSIPDMTAAINDFNKLHENCEPTWKQPFPPPEATLPEKMNFWLQHGERGVSSETMFEVISGKILISGQGGRKGHPHDPDDFKRCYLLLKTIPEFKSSLSKMRAESAEWSRLVDNWEMLTIMLEEQLNGKKNDMFSFMEKIINGN